ncbi:signal peptidase I [Murdochiella massiliensis]|uniref:signal peptidase I n=1 Tax=Murdochiella massiliensis TaxID=1673723 RepID=UPI0008372595|nr:signal peptidase I [Murdochiella massiliensis]
MTKEQNNRRLLSLDAIFMEEEPEKESDQITNPSLEAVESAAEIAIESTSESEPPEEADFVSVDSSSSEEDKEDITAPGPVEEPDLGPVIPPTSVGQPNEPPKSAKRGIRDLRRYLDDHLSEETKEKLEQEQRAERSAREAEMLNREAPIPDVLYSDSSDPDETIMEPKPTEKPWEATPASSVITVPKEEPELAPTEEEVVSESMEKAHSNERKDNPYEDDTEDLTIVLPRVEEETFDADRTQVFSAVHPEEILKDESDEEITEAVTFNNTSPIDAQDTARQQKNWPLDEEQPHTANPTPAYADEEAEDKKTEAKGFRGVFFNWILPISVALLLAIVIRFFVGGATTVSGTSMEPTLHNGDFLLVSKIPTYFKNYKRGDVLIIDSPDLNEFYVKRLIGLPGETVEIQDGKVFIDGKWMKEFYTDQETVSYANAKWTLGNNEYFVLGDNRGTGASNDSRLFGPVLAEHIKAVSRLRIWPITKMMLMY